jgi:hypothetical protein
MPTLRSSLIIRVEPPCRTALLSTAGFIATFKIPRRNPFTKPSNPLVSAPFSTLSDTSVTTANSRFDPAALIVCSKSPRYRLVPPCPFLRSPLLRMLNIPRVSPCISMEPLDGSKKTSRDDEAESSKSEANAGGRSELPRAI